MNIYTQHLTISRVERDLQPKEVQAIFNSNPDFVRDSEGSDDRSAHTIEEVSRGRYSPGKREKINGS